MPSQTLALQGPEEARACVERAMAAGKPSRRFILCPTSSPAVFKTGLPEQVLANYQAMIERYLELARY